MAPGVFWCGEPEQDSAANCGQVEVITEFRSIICFNLVTTKTAKEVIGPIP